MSANETGHPTANFKAPMWLRSLPGRQVNRAVAVGRRKALEKYLARWHVLLAAAVVPPGHRGQRGEVCSLWRRRLWREAAEKSRDS